MKKILLGLGTSLLAVIPLAAVVSCSSTETPTIDTEVAKFNTSVATTKADMNAVAAAKTINDAKDDAGKLTKLKDLVTEVPTVAEGFSFTITSAKANSTTLEVSIKVSETATPANNKEATFKVTGFKALSAIEEAESKFATPGVATNKAITSAEVVKRITTGADAAAKLAELEKIVDVPKTTGVTVEVKTASVVTATPTKIEVGITLTEGTNTANVTWTVTGLVDETVAQAAMDEEVKKIVNKDAVAGSGTAQAAIDAIKADTTKIVDYYPVTLSEGFTYTVNGTPTLAGLVISVTLTVKSPIEGIATIDKDVTITFTS